MKTRHGLLLLLLVSLILVSPGFAQEWTRFRGPNGEGISHCKTIPTKWTDKDFRWKIELPGKGHSSPVVWGQQIWMSTATKDGKELARKFKVDLSAGLSVVDDKPVQLFTLGSAKV